MYKCFVDVEKAFDRVPRKVMEWAMRKKGISEEMTWAVMSLYDGAKTRVRVESAYSEEFKVKAGVHQGSVLSPLLFAIVVDVITENAKRGVVNELLYRVYHKDIHPPPLELNPKGLGKKQKYCYKLY